MNNKWQYVYCWSERFIQLICLAFNLSDVVRVKYFISRIENSIQEMKGNIAVFNICMAMNIF